MINVGIAILLSSLIIKRIKRMSALIIIFLIWCCGSVMSVVKSIIKRGCACYIWAIDTNNGYRCAVSVNCVERVI